MPQTASEILQRRLNSLFQEDESTAPLGRRLWLRAEKLFILVARKTRLDLCLERAAAPPAAHDNDVMELIKKFKVHLE